MDEAQKGITLTANELGIANFALKIDYNNQGEKVARMLTVDQMKDGISINDKLEASCEEKILDGKAQNVFKESVVNFTTTEKALLLTFIDRKWAVDDAKHYMSLKEKLSA